MERVINLLKGSYWRLDLSRIKLTSLELDFLSNFFDMSFENVIDDFSFEDKNFLILKKKFKYLPYIH